MFLKARSFRIFESAHLPGQRDLTDSEWLQWDAAGRNDYFHGKRRAKIGEHEKNFSAARYLELYPDVAAANKRGGAEWAYQHFIRSGMFEILSGRRQDRIGLADWGQASVFVTRKVPAGFLHVLGLKYSTKPDDPKFLAVFAEGQLQVVDGFDLDVVEAHALPTETSFWIYGAFISPAAVLGVTVSARIDGRRLETLIVSNGYADANKSAEELRDASIVHWMLKSEVISRQGATIPECLEELFGDHSQQQKFYADEIRLVNDSCLLFRGWCLDLIEPFRSILVLANDQAVSFTPDQMLRVPRNDLLDQAGNIDEHVFESGISGLAKYPVAARKDATCLVMMVSQTLVSWGIFPVTYTAGAPKAALRSLISTLPFPGSQLFARFIHAGAGSILGDLLKEQSGEPATFSEESYGVLPSKPIASVVIPLYGRMDFIKFQLARFSEDADVREVELIYVVDDPKNREVARNIADFSWSVFQLPFRILYLDRNQGFGGANNMGAKVARGERIIFLNSDVIPKGPGWIRQLLEPLDDPDNGIVGARLLYHDDTIQHDGLKHSTERYLGLDGLAAGIHPGKGIKPQDESRGVFPVAAVTGACMAMAKADFERVGGFSPEYWIGDYEDSDLCLKIRVLGKQIVINRGCVLYHLERQSMPFDPISRMASILNAHTHQMKWASALQRDGLILRSK